MGTLNQSYELNVGSINKSFQIIAPKKDIYNSSLKLKRKKKRDGERDEHFMHTK